MNPEYTPCLPCDSKTGAYTLCSACLDNRNIINRLNLKIEILETKAKLVLLEFQYSQERRESLRKRPIIDPERVQEVIMDKAMWPCLAKDCKNTAEAHSAFCPSCLEAHQQGLEVPT